MEFPDDMGFRLTCVHASGQVFAELMFQRTATAKAPWTIVQADDKRRARLNAMRWLLSTFDYPEKRASVLTPDPGFVRVEGA